MELTQTKQDVFVVILQSDFQREIEKFGELVLDSNVVASSESEAITFTAEELGIKKKHLIARNKEKLSPVELEQIKALTFKYFRPDGIQSATVNRVQFDHIGFGYLLAVYKEDNFYIFENDDQDDSGYNFKNRHISFQSLMTELEEKLEDLYYY